MKTKFVGDSGTSYVLVEYRGEIRVRATVPAYFHGSYTYFLPVNEVKLEETKAKIKKNSGWSRREQDTVKILAIDNILGIDWSMIEVMALMYGETTMLRKGFNNRIQEAMNDANYRLVAQIAQEAQEAGL